MMLRCALIVVVLVAAATADYRESTDAFHDVLHFVNGPFSDKSVLDEANLDEIYHEMFEKAECEEKTSNCSQCMEDFLAATGTTISTIEEWNSMSACLLYALLDVPTFCNLTTLEMSQLDCDQSLLQVINSTNSDALGEEEFEHLLDELSHDFSAGGHEEEEEDHGDEEEEEDDHHDEDDEEEEGDHHDEEEGGDHGEEEEHHENAGCFGEQVLLNSLGLDHEETLPVAKLSEVSGVLISYLAQDMTFDEDCEPQPSPGDILSDLVEELGVNGTITEEGFETILEKLGIGSVAGAVVVEEEEDGHDDGHGHKRSISSSSFTRRHKRSAADGDHHITEQCLSEATLASVYNLDLENGITKLQFLELCPALIQQTVGGHCNAVPVETTASTAPEKASDLEVYGYGVLAVVIVSLLSLLGALLIPCLEKTSVRYILNMFVAMGVSTMLADSLLHLMPQALGLHAHGDDHEDEAHVGHEDEPVLTETTLLQLTVCLAIYLLYLFESLMARFRPHTKVSTESHGHSHTDMDIGKDGHKVKPADTESTSDGSNVWASSRELTNDEEKKGIPNVALMILIGDGIHNFIDGIAIGAAFSSSLTDGLGTSIAVFCHELPHELGDFSILIKSGMSTCKAIVFNLLSAATCLIGLFIGAALGENDDIRKWLLAITAGMFIYVALVNMLPELISTKEGKWWIYFLVQNIGLLLGIALMLVISVVEEILVHG